MKALLILIVAAGTVQGASSLGPDQTLQVREIEFSTLANCREAAAQLTSAGRRSNEWARIFSVEGSTNRVLVPAPIVIAECVVR